MPESAPLSPELFRFLADLKRNNRREWFQQNKQRYEEHVRGPMLRLIADFQKPLATISKHFVADPSPVGGSMFRIYRDTRFSKDKTPYKTAASAHFRHAAAGDVHAPGFYLHLSPDDAFVGVGLWRPDGRALTKIRDTIVAKPSRWKAVLTDEVFAGRYELRDGEALKRPPRGYDPGHPYVEDLKKRSFVGIASLSQKDACAPDFVDRLTDLCRAGSPLVRFLAEALELRF